MRKPAHLWPRRPRAIVHADRQEILRLAEKWDALHACQISRCSDIAEIETVGLFTVPKDADWDRLILNPTVINSRCHTYSRYTKTLAPGYLITSLQLQNDEELLISSDDLRILLHFQGVESQRPSQCNWSKVQG